MAGVLKTILGIGFLMVVSCQSSDFDVPNELNQPDEEWFFKSGKSPFKAKSALEDFESYASNAVSFPYYDNISNANNRFWTIKSFNGNKYLQFSAYNSIDYTLKTYKAYWVIPMDGTKYNTVSFKTLDGYFDGAVLKVYYTHALDFGQQPNALLWKDITSEFKISYSNPNKYGVDFINTGQYTIPNMVAKTHLIFEYVGGRNKGTTTIQVDDIEFSKR